MQHIDTVRARYKRKGQKKILVIKLQGLRLNVVIFVNFFNIRTATMLVLMNVNVKFNEMHRSVQKCGKHTRT
jgi:hypothetical protein